MIACCHRADSTACCCDHFPSTPLPHMANPHPPSSTALVWFRRDLRLTDQPALTQALARYAQVIPVYIWAPEEDGDWAPGAASRWWLHHSLEALDRDLRDRGSALVIRQGRSAEQLDQLVAQTGASAVYWNRLYEPHTVERDRGLKTALRARGVDARSFNSALLIEPWTLLNGQGEAYRVFTPFWRAACGKLNLTEAVLPAPESMPGPALPSLPLQALQLLPTRDWACRFTERWNPGERGALALLDRFCREALSHYSTQRDLPGIDGTSRLSAHLHFGEIGPRQIAARLRADGAVDASGSVKYLSELGWREFAHHLLHHFPHTCAAPLNPAYADFPWRAATASAADLRAWQRGRTGVPLVDAGMRQLWQHGWMHNRVRMVCASFLCKNLLIPWQQGARWFWDTLVDASLANNSLGWQWTAGCGADAAPYFRVFNPVLQSEKFDPQGLYLRQWLPELAGLSGKALHQGAAVNGYPSPIVDLAQSRQRALDHWQTIRS